MTATLKHVGYGSHGHPVYVVLDERGKFVTRGLHGQFQFYVREAQEIKRQHDARQSAKPN